MAFTKKDADELERARATIARLEAAEALAGEELIATLDTLGLRLAHWAAACHVMQNADMIRDALEPFDSGMRAAPSAA